jgi:predicted nucleic acid-binding protein
MARRSSWWSLLRNSSGRVGAGLIAAIAKVRNMTFVTRNTSDVTRTGVRLLSPFGSQAGKEA